MSDPEPTASEAEISAGPAHDRSTGPETDEVQARTGAEQPWDPEDLAAARGMDPTPDNIQRRRRELEDLGPAAVEKTVP